MSDELPDLPQLFDARLGRIPAMIAPA